MKLDPRLFTEARFEDYETDEPFEKVNEIRFFRSEMDDEWYVEFGHKTAGACSYVSGTFKVNQNSTLNELHGMSEEVTVFGMYPWSDY